MVEMELDRRDLTALPRAPNRVLSVSQAMVFAAPSAISTQGTTEDSQSLELPEETKPGHGHRLSH